MRGAAILRPVVMGLHWSAAILIVAYLAGVLPGIVLALHALVWLGITAVWGPRGTPSPALSPQLRIVAHRGHVVLLVLYWAGAALAAFGWPLARDVLLATLAAAALHALVNLYRAMVLGDGALRRITPRALH